MENNCASLYRNPSKIVGSYGPDKNLTFKCDHDLGHTLTNVSNGTSTHDGEQSCQIILKSIHNCRSYGLDKFGRMHGCMHIHQTVILCLAHLKWARQKYTNLFN